MSYTGYVPFLSAINTWISQNNFEDRLTSTYAATEPTDVPNVSKVISMIAAGVSFRGGYDASSGAYPSTGGSLPGGEIGAGDHWVITVAGTVGLILVLVGDTLTALIQDPGQISTNWFINAAGVSSVFGRFGNIVAVSGDYNISQITNGLSNVLTSANIFVGNGSGIATGVSLSGDIGISNTGLTTLATVNATVGSFGSSTSIPSFTVNGKGLLTAAGSSVVIAPAGTLTGTTLASNVVSSSLTSVGTLITGVWNATAIDLTNYASGILQAAQFPALTGDVTTTAGSLSTTISNATITSKLLTGYVAGTNTPIVATDSILTAFQNLQAQVSGTSGAAITSLTGDATATGPGASALTLATVNSNVGSFGSSTSIPSFTVNGKGLLTAAGSSVVIAPAGTLTGTTLASNVVSSSLTSVGTLITGVWQGTIVDPIFGGTGINNGTSTLTLAGALATVGAFASTFTFTGPTGVTFPTSGTLLTTTGNSGSTVVTDPTTATTAALNLALSNILAASGGTGIVSVFGRTGAVVATTGDYTIAQITNGLTNVLTSAFLLVGNSINVASGVALSGDATINNTGVLTLATVNSNVGSFGSSTSIPSFTVNGKGLLTAASTNAVIAPAGTLSGTTLNSTVVTSSLTSVGTIATGTWQAGIIATSYGGLGVNASTTNATVYGFNVQNSLNLNGSVALQSSAYSGIFPSFAFISIASQNLLYFGLTQNVAFSNYGYVKNNQSNITGPANLAFSFTLGIGIFYVEANLYATGGSTGWAKFQITNGTGTLIGSSNKKGFVQTTGATGGASDWTASDPATSIITVTSGTTQVFINIYEIASGNYIVLDSPSGPTGSFVKVTQIG